MSEDSCCICATVVSGSVCAVVVVAAIITGVVVGTSYAHVRTNEMCVVYNTFSKTFDDVPLSEGRHYVGTMAQLFCLPTTLQSLVYVDGGAVQCLSHEGMLMVLDVQVDYRLAGDADLQTVLRTFGTFDQYRLFVDSMARDTIKDVCGQYTAEEYFERRSAINAHMQRQIDEYFQEHTALIVDLLQLINIDHADVFEAANRDKQDVEQQVERVMRQRNEQLTAARTRQLSAEIAANTTRAQADVAARAILDTARTESVAVETRRWQERTAALVSVLTGLGDGADRQSMIEAYVRHVLLASQVEPIVQIH